MKGVTVSALSAIDIALWDIKGKALELPVFKLLGGAYRNKARAYATGLSEPQNVPDVSQALVNEALGYKKEGFNGMKLKVGYGIDKDVAYVKAIREAIGEDIYLMASAANIPLLPHVWGTNVGLAASLQFFAALPHFPERRFPAEPFFEYDRSPHPFREEVTLEKFVLKEGYLDIPDRPGLGVSLDLKYLEKHAL